MAKRLRDEPIYLAPEILAYRDEKYNPIIVDERIGKQINIDNIDDKILIYKRQVEEWFINRAKSLMRGKNRNKNIFVILMIATAYIEGVQQYREGETSENRSKKMFSNGIKRLFKLQGVDENHLDNLYKHLRCGLFHNGMSGDMIVLNCDFENAITFSANIININPKLLLEIIIRDFNKYIEDLSNVDNEELRLNFDKMFDIA